MSRYNNRVQEADKRLVSRYLNCCGVQIVSKIELFAILVSQVDTKRKARNSGLFCFYSTVSNGYFTPEKINPMKILFHFSPGTFNFHRVQTFIAELIKHLAFADLFKNICSQHFNDVQSLFQPSPSRPYRPIWSRSV